MLEIGLILAAFAFGFLIAGMVAGGRNQDEARAAAQLAAAVEGFTAQCRRRADTDAGLSVTPQELQTLETALAVNRELHAG